MNTETHLTDLEAKVLACWPTSYDDMEAQLQDNMSATDVDELAVETKLPVPTVKGVTGTLAQKGLVESDNGEGRGDGTVCLWLTEAGVKVLYGEVLPAQQKEKGKEPKGKGR